METFVKPVLNNNTPDALILHISYNDTGNKQLTENGIVDWTVKLVGECKEKM